MNLESEEEIQEKDQEEDQEDDNKDQEDQESSKINSPKHLVICGGVTYGFIFYGILCKLIESKFLNMKSLKSIHATSVGSIVAVCLAIEQDLDILNNYFLNRPWHELLPFSINKIMGSVKSCGIYDNNFLRQMMEPIFSANGLNVDTMTMKELYEYTNTDIHIYTTNVTTFEVVSINYKTHPTWRVLDAVYVSCCIPIIFQPYKDVNTKDYYIDGGYLINYPIYPCIKYCNAEKDPLNSILGVQLNLKDGCCESLYDTINNSENLSLMDYIYMIMNKVLWKLVKLQPIESFSTDDKDNPVEIFVDTKKYSMNLLQIAKHRNIRKEYIDLGIQHAIDFLNKHKLI